MVAFFHFGRNPAGYILVETGSENMRTDLKREASVNSITYLFLLPSGLLESINIVQQEGHHHHHPATAPYAAGIHNEVVARVSEDLGYHMTIE